MIQRFSSSTVRDVARKAGVSVATVSRYLNHNTPISPEVIERLDQAMNELGYIPHVMMRHLASRKTRVVGLLLNSRHNDFFVSLLNGVEAVVREKGYNLIIATGYANSQGHLRPPIDPPNIDGLLVFSDSLADGELASLNAAGFPVVLIHRTPPPQTPIPSVTVENIESSRSLVEHLIKVHGKRHILFLRGPGNQEDSRQREAGYRSALQANGISVDENLILNGNFEPDIAYTVMNELLDHENKIAFDAVFTGDDNAAIGVLRALHQHGLSIPEDVSVVGFDDLGIAPFLDPPLTTVRVPTETVGRMATERLFRVLENHPGEEVTILPTEIIFRRSCGCAS